MPLPGFRHRGDGCLIILLLYEGKAQNMGRSPTVGHDPIAQPNYNNIKQLASIKYIIQLLVSLANDSTSNQIKSILTSAMAAMPDYLELADASAANQLFHSDKNRRP